MAKRTPAEKAIRAFDFSDYGMDEVAPRSKYAEWVPALAAAVEQAVREQVAQEIRDFAPHAAADGDTPDALLGLLTAATIADRSRLTTEQLADQLDALLAVAPPCGSCNGAKWVDDENWQPDPDDIRDRAPIVRTEGNGRIPCGSCNHGGWDEPDTATEEA